MVHRKIITILNIAVLQFIFATTYHVPDDVASIQEAIQLSEDGDVVLIAPGTYYENINFLGKGITVASMAYTTGDLSYIEQTIIDGSSNGTVVTFRNYEDRSSVLFGLSITNGSGSISFDYELAGSRVAGGIYAFRAGPSIQYCNIYNHTVYPPDAANLAYGGGMTFYGAYVSFGGGINYYPLIENCIIYDNSANLGGGLYFYSGVSGNVNNCIIRNNTSINGWAGGGVFLSWSVPTFYKCVFTENQSTFNGGAFWIGWGGQTHIINCTIVDNHAVLGGGISTYNGVSPVIINSIIRDNTNNDIFMDQNDGHSVLTISGSNIDGGLNGIYINPITPNSLMYFASNFDSDPQFTITDDENNFSYLFDSPCVDAGITDLNISANDPFFNDFGMWWYGVEFNSEVGLVPGPISTPIDNFSFINIPDAGAFEFNPSVPHLMLIENNLTSDDDNIANPGEIISFSTYMQNYSEAEIINAEIELITEASGIIPLQNQCSFDNLISMQDNFCDFEFALSSLVQTGNMEFQFDITMTDFLNVEYEQTIPITILISYNQEGFPSQTEAQIQAAPAVYDLNDDNEIDIIFADFAGDVYALNSSGELLEGFPFHTEDQIWAAQAIADLNNDGEVEIIIASKDDHLYIIDGYGELITDYNTDQWLTATPVIGNLDDDDDLEIVFGSYNNSGKLFAIDMDGTDLPGFPIEINEKIFSGVALADFNDDQKDDIVLGTEEDNLWLIYSDGVTAPNFPLSFDNKFKTAPSIIDFGTDKIIIAANRDRSLYGISSDGSIMFEMPSESWEWTTPAFYDLDESIGIFIANGTWVYGIDQNGNNLEGWPVNILANITSAPVLSDIDGDNDPEIIIATTTGYIHILNLNGTPEILSQIGPSLFEQYSSSMSIQDTDYDNDLEIVLGSTQNGLFNIDLKTEGSSENYWNMFRGNLHRTGLFESSHQLDINDNLVLPTEFKIDNVYPNPFNPTTRINYSIPHKMNVKISVFDIHGNKINNLVNSVHSRGIYTIDWTPELLAANIYFIKMISDKFSQTEKVIFLK